jgi:hypothetical protein
MKALGLVCVLAGALTLFGSAQMARASGDEGCQNVHAVGVGQDLGGGNTTATITHGGLLNGTTNAHFDVDLTGGPPVFPIAGTLTLTTKHGTLTVNLTGTLDVSTGAFNATGPITGGTGKLAGATGTLSFSGVENLATGAFTETITGTLCRADGEGDD